MADKSLTAPKTHSFDTVEISPRTQNYGKNAQTRLSLPAFTAEAREEDEDMGKHSLLLDDGVKGTIDEDQELDDLEQTIEDADTHHSSSATKFGTFDGVLGRCLLCMWGVIMFLRTGWIVGQAGIWQATLVIVASGAITFSTTLSLSAICTNGEIQHGGPYFLISRSLGPAFGAVIGVLFAIGNCIGVALHLVGFSEAITSLYSGSVFFDYDIQLFAEIGLFFLLVLALFGVGWIIRFNLLLLALMFISIIIFVIGTFTTDPDRESLGFTGYSASTFADNWNEKYQSGWDFLAMIGIFFPSVTGCMAGANISGDLRNPARAIPVGTVAAVLFSLIVYIIIAWMLGATCIRESLDGTGGLYNDYVIMSNVSLWRPLVDMGIFASTFSSATSCFVAAPRIFKALCDDGLFPFLNFFAVGRKKDGEPVRVYIVVTIVCFLVMLSGNINVIAPIVTNFFLITYALINYSVFMWDSSKVAGWRPTFTYFDGKLSLLTALLCIVLMFLIDWITAFITVIAGGAIYKYIDNKDLNNLDWGTLTESAMYNKACKIILKYQTIKQHAKNVRPTFLIFNYGSIKSERTPDVVDLFELSQCLNYSDSLIVLGDIILGNLDDPNIAHEYMMKKLDFAKYNKDKNLTNEMIRQCVVEICVAPTFQQGCRNMLQLSGMGSMKPNVVIIKMGSADVFVKDADNPTKQPLWFCNLSDALTTGCGVIMTPSNFSFDTLTTHVYDRRKSSMLALKSKSIEDNDDSAPPPYIDVWWLFDDGGLTILSSYLLTKSKRFKGCKLRIMVLLDLVGLNQQTHMVKLMSKLRIDADIIEVKMPKGTKVLAETQRNSSGMPDHLRTDSMKKGDDDDNSQPNIVLSDNGPSEELGTENKANDNTNVDDDDELMNIHGSVKMISNFAQKKISNYKQIGETIDNKCRQLNTSLCVLTLPFPRKKYSWWEYAAIVNHLMPTNVPTLFVRGNQEQLLTFSL